MYKRYLRAGLYNNGKHKKELVHRLVADAFLDNPNKLLVVNHKNEDKEDNRVCNFIYGYYQRQPQLWYIAR